MNSRVVFLLPLSAGFGWDRADVVSIYSFAVLASGVSGPMVGRMFDRVGPRAIYMLGLGLMGGGLVLAPLATALWQFQLCLGLATGVGGLDWAEVRPLIAKHLGDLKIPVYVYAVYHAGVAAREAA